MRKRLLDKLYVGDISDCKAAVGKNWSVIHACKNPCHAGKCGQKVEVGSRDYYSHRDGTHLYLNIIDPTAPLFHRRVFDDFLKFAREAWQQDRPMLIHCNKGESRAPSLALVFLAKVLGKIRNSSFDDAWIDFDLLLGADRYTPNEGIEIWLREHWRELDGGVRLPYMDFGAESATARGEQIPVSEVTIPLDDEAMCMEIARAQPLFHFAGFSQIENKEHVWVNPEPNSLQFDIDEAYTHCMEANESCRLIILKPRQVGCSTKCAHTCYHHMRRWKSDMILMGDKSARSVTAYNIFNGFADHDAFPGWDSSYRYNTLAGVFTYPDGSKGLIEHDTALDPKAGIGGTRQVVWMTEAARYLKAQGRDKKVITAVLNSLADVPRSLGIAESTAEGASGWFYETWQNAVTLEDRKKGVAGNGWIKVFAPWFAFTEHALQRKPEYADYFKPDLDDRERKGILLYDWTAEQIAWRRMKIAKDCANDLRMFDQDFPEDPESCFLASGRPRFDMMRLAAMERLAKLRAKLDTHRVGKLDRSIDKKPSFLDCRDGSSWLWVSEEPTYGLSYIGFVDPCTGAQNEGSPFPDAHAAGIIRVGYFDKERNVWVKDKLVAVIDVPTGCRWPDNLLGERMKLLLDWYGNCEVVPETGNGLGVLLALQNNGCRVYEREKMDSMYPGGAKLRVAGWETNKDTRQLVVNAVADAITSEEHGFECDYLPALTEMKTFVINDRGKAEAKSGCHDDWVMGPGMALYNKNRASVLHPPALFDRRQQNEYIDLPGGLSTAALS